MKRPTAISLSPNTENDDVVLALKTLLSPHKWLDDREVEKLEKEFARKFGKSDKAIAVNSGRSAQYLILKALGIGKGDEVVIQAFTCVAVPNSILWLKAKPLYVDLDESYNVDPKDLLKKMSEKTKAIIVQHTFGMPAELDKIKKIAQSRKIILIEDCSHSLGASYNGEPVGTLGDVSFFSFGRDKVLSSVFGGMILCSNESLYKKIKDEKDRLKLPSHCWVFQQLFHPIAFALILPLYNIVLGKLLLVFLQKTGLLSKAVYAKEKIGDKPRFFPAKMPGGLAVLAQNQLSKLDKYNLHRKKMAGYYFNKLQGLQLVLPPRHKGSIWLRFPVRLKDADSLYRFVKRKGVLLGNWYRGVVMPVKELSLVGYKEGSCPTAEKYSRNILNLPTYPTLGMKGAQKVAVLLETWLSIN